MKYVIYIIQVLLCCTLLFGCNEKNKPVINDTEVLHQNEDQLTQIIIYDVFSPPVASRIYAYTSLASYEAIRFAKPGYASIAEKLNDFGKMRITGKSSDSLRFKVPTLRNVYISENYMHDGRFNTLAQCINHYRNGIQQSATLDPLLVGGITMTNTEATDLSLFLRTLTDSSFLIDPLYKKP